MWKALSILLLVTGCGGDGPSTRPPPPPSGKLFVFTDAHIKSLKNSQLVTPQTCDIGHCYKVRYIPTKTGSMHIGKDFLLSRKVMNATLSYKIRIPKDFQFTFGGKALGVRPEKASKAGAGKPPLGRWSARVMWSKWKGLRTYTYHQAMKGPFGDHGPRISEPVINDGKWHNVELKVSVGNYTRLKIDGVVVSEQVPFVTSSAIAKFSFTTFHGGNSLKYAPTKTQVLYFADIEVK